MKLFNTDPIYNSKWNHIISVVWVYLMIFPTTDLLNYSVPILLCLLYDNKSSRSSIITPLLILLVPTLLFNLGQPYMDFKAIVRLVTFGIIFFTFASLKGYHILFPYIFFAAGYVLLSQVSISYGIPILANFFDSTYQISEKILETYQTELATLSAADVVTGTRLGGIYINPNNCASYMTLLYATGLCEIKQLNNKKATYLFVGIVLISFIITGSRTSLICFAVISLFYLHNIGLDIKRYAILLAVLGVVFAYTSASSLRMFKIDEGMDNSVGVKMMLLGQYLDRCDNLLFLLFGAGDIRVTEVLYNIDSRGCDCDLGNVLIVFGAIFYIGYLIFYYKIYKAITPEKRVILFVLLWSFSNSIMISYRMCPVWFISLGLVYRSAFSDKNKLTIS